MKRVSWILFRVAFWPFLFLFLGVYVVMLVRPAFRACTGKWYAFKSSPRWVVKFTSWLGPFDESAPDLTHRLYLEAVEEMCLRNRLKRKAS